MLTNALIYLFAAVISVPLAKRLGMGSVLGYLIAGVIIGPYALGLVGQQQDVMHFAEFGVVMMLFLIGLELQPEKLWSLRKPILGLGGSQVLITGAIITGIVAFFGFQWQTSLALGLTLALSSTAIVLQTLQEKNLLKTQTGQNAFSVLLFQDIAVIPILALLPLLVIQDLQLPTGADNDLHAETIQTPLSEAHSVNEPTITSNDHDSGHSSNSNNDSNNTHPHDDSAGSHGHSLISGLPTYLQVIVILTSIVAIVAAGKWIANPVFRYVAEAKLREIFTALSLLIVVAITAMMTALGLSPALGAFLAGVVLAENEYRHEVELSVEPFKSLLLGLFFITVGAGINIPLMIDSPFIITACVAGLVLVKAIVLACLAYLFKFSFNQGSIFTVALAQGGEFGFVLLGLSSQLGIIDAEINNLTTLVVALSMLLTPLLLITLEAFLSRSTQDASIEEDVIDSKGDVIIAGYGRFGQVVGRLLSTQGHKLTILDHSPGQINMLRRFGNKVFYGDAAREDLLEAAGANDAKLLVVAVADIEKSLEIIHTAKTHYPNLKIAARAIDRQHAYQLIKEKITAIRRESFDSAINLGTQALELLGSDPIHAKQAGQVFSEYDEESLHLLADLWGDDKRYGLAVKQRLNDLTNVLEADAEQFKTAESSDADKA